MNNSRLAVLLKIVIVVLLTTLAAGCMPMSRLQKAVAGGSISDVDNLLAHGENINEVNPLHGTALTVAVFYRNTPMVRHLLDKGADANLGTPLSTAAWSGDRELAQLLIGKGADPNFSGGKDLPLHSAAEQNRGSMVGLLLSAGANPNGQGGVDCPGSVAMQRGYDDVVSRLLEAGADPDRCRNLYLAVRYSPSLLTTRLLLEYGADANVADESGMTALHYAALDGMDEHVRLLLEYGAKTGLIDRSGKVAADYAREHKHPEIVTILLQSQNR